MTGSRLATILILLVVLGFPFAILVVEGMASGAGASTLLDPRIRT